MKLLLVEDDHDLSEFVREGLEREGFSVDQSPNGQEAILMASQNRYDVILLDVMMPGLNGHQVLKKLRGKGHQGAIIFVTCKGQERDKLEGLNGGADDYIVKPFLLTELVARVRAVLRRTGKALEAQDGKSIIKVGELSMDLPRRQVKRGNQAVSLTKKEFDLLECLMRRPGHVLSQTVLAQQLNNHDFTTSTNTIEVHIKNVRAKIGDDDSQLIRTVRGCGYVLDA